MFTTQNSGKLVTVRPLKHSDYNNWLDSFLQRRPSQHQYDEGAIDMNECTPEWFDALVLRQQSLAAQDDTYVFGIFRQSDGKHLGAIDFTTLLREEFQWARVGYTIHNQYWQKGYGKEAMQLALTIGQKELGYHRIEAHINLDNLASQKLAESIGMEYEGVRKGFIFENGEWVDHVIYAAVK
ncbi:GNAT family N-acetyltransferase [uncultured Enterococcus sp.]|uniref:GNAT family N-acetyltransferase n=1 Tax=uncultured Enterococcus sp. TaxID=167972 RepID=UPI0025FF9ABB|nr:GNAT family protein [uncultured Enterococcus sp.]